MNAKEHAEFVLRRIGEMPVFDGNAILLVLQDEFEKQDAALLARVGELERKVAMTFIPAGEWDICLTHNRAFESKEGCLKCALEAAEQERDAEREIVKSVTALVNEWRFIAIERPMPTDRAIGYETCADELAAALGAK